MDSHAVVLEISSDEEVNWAAHVGRGITDDGDDDHNWLAELLKEVNKADSGENGGGGGDSDEVVVVSELLSAKVPRKRSKSRSKSSPLVDLDDDCVILQNDPDKAVEIRNDDPNDGDEDDGSDDLRVVGEKGQVACRDYPHPRHLCIKFPFSSTPNQNHCNQCYCYVCDSLAPCLHWGNGSLSFDHCHATDKDEFWRHQRKNFKNGNKPVSKITNMPLLDHLPPPGMPVRPPSARVQPTPVAHNQFLRPCLPTNFGVSTGFLPRNKYQPSFISRDGVHHNYSLGTTQVHRPVFKRPGVVGAVGNRYPNGSHQGNLRIPTPGARNPSNMMIQGQNRYLAQSNLVDSSVPFLQNRTSPLLHEPSTFPSQFSGQLTPETSFDFPPSFQPPRMDLDPYLENSSVLQPQMVLSRPSYIAPNEPQVPPPPISVSDYTQNPAHKESQSQRDTMVPSFTDQSATMAPSFADQWQQPTAESCQLEAAAATNEPIVAGLVDYQYDNWMFDNQVVEPGSMDFLGPYPYGFNEFSPDSTFIDTGPIFDF